MRHCLDGTASGGILALPLTVKASAPDPPGLGVSWASDVPTTVYDAKTYPDLPMHPKGDGVSEDGAAIAEDQLWVAAHGGGILYLSEGTYRIDKADDWLVLYGGAVVRGAGKGKTVLQIGYVLTPDFHFPITFRGDNAVPEGLMDLTIQDVNTGAPNRILNTYFGDPRRVSLKNVEIKMGSAAHEIDLPRVRGLLIDGCTFNSASMSFGTLAISASSDVRSTNTTEYHRAGGSS